MPIALQLPALSPTMKDGRITKWIKEEGDVVTPGMALAECETDKSNLEIEAYDAGVLLKIVVPAGSTAPVGSTIAWIGKKGEVIPVDAALAHAPSPSRASLEHPGAAGAAMTAPGARAEPSGSGGGIGQRVRSSPLARTMAQQRGIDLGRISGTGPNGRVVRRDVESVAAPAAVVSVVPIARGAPTRIPLTHLRKVIGDRLTSVKPGVPHFYLQIDVDMERASEVKDELALAGLKISLNDLVTKAAANAVALSPAMNQSLDGDHLLQFHNVDVGVAVALDEGLITPVIRDADKKSLQDLSAEIRFLADRARRRALKPEEYSGGALTVSNLGMHGVDSFIAVINPPQAAILAVGRVEPRVVVRDDAMVIRKMMSVTLSGDHRVIDGATGAKYLAKFKEYVEHPVRLLV
jgi:pyruvate dehydrogenase E2 component (dihydrolipoamide acetyltransferase)